MTKNYLVTQGVSPARYYQMRFLFWNVRGLAKKARRGQIKEMIKQENLDGLGLPETMKSDFDSKELSQMVSGGDFYWFWLPSRGLSGGILMGIKGDVLEIEDNWIGEFCIQVTLRERRLNVRWSLITVYGPASHDFSIDFIKEL